MQKPNAAERVRLIAAKRMRERRLEVFEAVARRAFELFEEHGRTPGRDRDDWLQAEAELLQPVRAMVSETNGGLTVRADVPGFTAREVQVSVEPHQVILSGTPDVLRVGNNGPARAERHSHWILRTIDLPADVDIAREGIDATFDHGVLTITLPKVQYAHAGGSR